MFDYQKNGEIETDKIRTILVTLGNPYDEAELERLIRQEDREGNYFIQYYYSLDAVACIRFACLYHGTTTT